MSEFLQSAFDHFHSEVDLILGAPIPFFATIIVIAVIEYLLVSALSHDRLAAQREKIRHLTKRVAKAEAELRELMAASPAQGSATELDGHNIRTIAESVAVAHGPAADGSTTEISPQPSLEAENSTDRVSPPESILATTQTDLPAPAAAHEHIAQQIAVGVARGAPSDEFEVNKPEIERAEDAPWARPSSAPSTSIPHLDISILNVQEGSRVGPVVEVEILSAIAMERLQACVFSSRTNQWYPQGPFWRNRGIPIATCHFGDENNQAGDSFKLSIIETQKPLNGPVGTLPYDVPQTNPLTVYRGGQPS